MSFEGSRLHMQCAFPAIAASILLYSVALCAQEPAQRGLPASAPNTDESSNRDLGSDNDDSGWVRAWMRVTEKARSSQPHLVAPLVTTHVMLVQQFRYDMSWQEDPSGTTITSNYGSSRGLEIIPSDRLNWVFLHPASSFMAQALRMDLATFRIR